MELISKIQEEGFVIDLLPPDCWVVVVVTAGLVVAAVVVVTTAPFEHSVIPLKVKEMICGATDAVANRIWYVKTKFAPWFCGPL